MRRMSAMIGAVVLGLAGAATLATVPSETSHAASANATFTVPSDDGYGVADCAASTCGKVVADQWCVAQGYARAVEFGLADIVETTGSIEVRPARATAVAARPLSITCSR